MFCVIVIKCIGKRPTNPNENPARGQIIGTSGDILGEESLFPYDEAIDKARIYNQIQLEATEPNDTWAIVVRDDEVVEPGTLVELLDSKGLN